MQKASLQISSMSQVRDQISRLSQAVEKVAARLGNTNLSPRPSKAIALDGLYAEHPLVPDDTARNAGGNEQHWVGLFHQIDKAATDLIEMRGSLDWIVGGQELVSLQGNRAAQALTLEQRKAELLDPLPIELRELIWSALLSLLVAHEKGQTMSMQELSLSLGASEEALRPPLAQLQRSELIWQANDTSKVGLLPSTIRQLNQILA